MPVIAIRLPTRNRRVTFCPSHQCASRALGTISMPNITATTPEVRCCSAR
mgnify:CR=1 FL=1